MYEYIKGILTVIQPAYIVLENQGIGYIIYMANPYRLTDDLNKEVTVFVHHSVREDAILLYGFRLEEEKKLFEKLIQVSGIGPKSGMAIMANEDHTGFIEAVEQEDTTFLMKYPGVGKKTAGRLILDLKGKLLEIAPDMVSSETAEVSRKEEVNSSLAEAKQALIALGYSQRELKRIEPALEEMEESSTDTYLREALSLLMKR